MSTWLTLSITSVWIIKLQTLSSKTHLSIFYTVMSGWGPADYIALLAVVSLLCSTWICYYQAAIWENDTTSLSLSYQA